MIVQVARGVGDGPTELAAFDAALVAAGVADRNLIYLSSVLPADSTVTTVDQVRRTPGQWGDRLYCVVAEAHTAVPGGQVWAGIGWVQDRLRQGLLVEHAAPSEVELCRLIAASLDGLCRNRYRRPGDFPVRGQHIAGATCGDKPVCALAVAVFQAQPWATARPLRRARPRTRRDLVRRVPAP